MCFSISIHQLLYARMTSIVSAPSDVTAVSPEELMLNVTWFDPLTQYYTGPGIDANVSL